MTTRRKRELAARLAAYQHDLAQAGTRYTTHAGLWVESARSEVMPAFAHAAAYVLAIVYRGVHNVPTNWDRIEHCEHSFAVRVHGHLASWDANPLTRLVVAAHDHMMRVQISARAPRLLEIVLSARTTRDKTAGSFENIPTIGDAVKFVRERGSAEFSTPPWSFVPYTPPADQ